MFRQYMTMALLCLATVATALSEDANRIPDLTKGETLVRRNPLVVGPLGLHCGVWRPRQRSDEYKDVLQFVVEEVEQGSPADGVLAKGDVIVGADGSGAPKVPMFDRHPDLAMPDAIDDAEARNPATINLLVWRPIGGDQGKSGVLTVELTLETLGQYSATAPYDCEKSKRILRKGLAALCEEDSPGQGGLNLLCLLTGDDPGNPENEKCQAKAREWAHQYKVAGIDEIKGGAWQVGSRLIVLAEYYLKTRDEEMLPTLKLYARRYANGQSWFGTTGHRWADERPDGGLNGPMGGYGALNSSGLHGFYGMLLAREAGVDDPAVAAAIKRADTFFASYAFKTGIPYGEHEAGMGGTSYDYNGHCGVAGLAFGLQEKRQKEARFFAKMSTAASGGERVWCHAGPFFSQLWNPLGAAVGGEGAANEHFRNIRWHLTMKRGWDGKFHYSKGYNGWSSAATQLMIYALPLQQTYTTGRDQNESLHLTGAELESVKATRGFDPKLLTTAALIEKLYCWAPPERSKAAEELARRAGDAKARADILTSLHALLSDRASTRLMRAGACFALSKIKDPSSASLLAGRLTDHDSLVQQEAAKALIALPADAVMPHLNTILEVAASSGQPTFPLVEGDPLQFAQGYLAKLLFDRKHGLLRDGIEGVDREKLWPAVRALAKTPAGAFRGSLGGLFSKLSADEVLELGDVIVDSVLIKSPGDSMFSSGIRKNGIQTLARHSLAPAFPLGMELGDINLLSQLGLTGLEGEMAAEMMQWVGEQQLLHGQDMTKILEALASGAPGKSLRKMKEIHSVTATPSTLALPVVSTALRVEATNHARRDEKETIYTWRKVYGPGKVEFTHNGTWSCKETTVTFTDGKPGNYRLEVAMSDVLGYSTVRECVDVTHLDKRGKLPSNRPPVAQAQALTAVPGLPLPIRLSGSDPDGDELGFIVTEQPKHGRLSGEGADLTYTANFGFNGTDRFAFTAADGQSSTESVFVEISVSDKNVGVAAYEGFDYPEGSIQGREGGSSFGFSAPWKIHKDTADHYLVVSGPQNDGAFPSTGGRLTNGKFWWYCSRRLDPAVLAQHRLLENGSELWFSAIFGSSEKYDHRFWFGLRKDSEESGADLGFRIGGGDLRATWNGKDSGTTRAGWGSRRAEQKFANDTPHMIIGRCVWGETDEEPDTLDIYRVFSAPGIAPVVLEEPVCTMKEVIDQSKLNSVYMRDTGGFIDEIRAGPTMNSVMLGTKPLPISNSQQGTSN